MNTLPLVFDDWPSSMLLAVNRHRPSSRNKVKTKTFGKCLKPTMRGWDASGPQNSYRPHGHSLHCNVTALFAPVEWEAADEEVN